MALIFISYRRRDYEGGVDAFEKLLRSRYGSTSVLLDQDAFAAGSNWQAEMKAAVVQSSVILCVIGDSWDDANTSLEGTDYLHEELTIARSLGKPIIPVIIGNGAGGRALSKLPKGIAWLSKLHAVDCSGPEHGRIDALERAIERIVPLDSGYGNSAVTMIADLFYSLMFPISAGGVALRGTSFGMMSALMGLGLSVTAMLILVMNMGNSVDVQGIVARALGVVVLFVGLMIGAAFSVE